MFPMESLLGGFGVRWVADELLGLGLGTWDEGGNGREETPF